MRIAYFNANMDQEHDGVARCVNRMINGAVARGHSVIGISASLPTDGASTPIFHVPSVVLPLQKDYRIALPGYRFFRRQIEDFKPDILHINSPCTLGFAAVAYAREGGIPVVATYHTHFPAYSRYYGLGMLEKTAWSITRRFYNSMNRTFVPTLPILQDIKAHGIMRLEQLSNGYDPSSFNPGYRSQEWRNRFVENDEPIILFVSRLVWEKNLHVFSDAYGMLRASGRRFQCVIVGDGHARAEFERMLPGAHFLGFQTGRDLSTAYASSDIYAFPSVTETFGLVTLEAMASGLVPVAARAGGAVELVQHGISGLLSKPNDATDFASKIGWLLDHPGSAFPMREQAIATAGHYQWDHILDRLFHLYTDVINESKRSTYTI